MRRGLTARVFAECEGMTDLLTWFLDFLGQLQEKALLQVERDDPTREVRRAGKGELTNRRQHRVHPHTQTHTWCIMTCRPCQVVLCTLWWSCPTGSCTAHVLITQQLWCGVVLP